MNVKYRFKELRSLAKDRGVSRWHQMNKRELCLALSLEHLKSKKFTLTCVETLEVTSWESVYSISKAYKVNTGCLLCYQSGKTPKNTGWIICNKNNKLFLS